MTFNERLKINEDAMYDILGTIETLEYDLQEEISSASKKLIEIEIKRLKSNLTLFEMRIRALKRKINKMEEKK